MYKLVTCIALTVLFLSALFFGWGGRVIAEHMTCKSFRTQGQAQVFFKTFKAKSLDGDHDDIACEALPKR